jgi:hypothetical protein
MTAVDFIARLIVIEKKDATKWSEDSTQQHADALPSPFDQDTPRDELMDEKTVSDVQAQHTTSTANHSQHGPRSVEKVSQLRSIYFLLRSPRAIAALLNTFIFGYVTWRYRSRS